VLAIHDNAQRGLLLVWPYEGEEERGWDHECLEHFRGDVLIYVGDWGQRSRSYRPVSRAFPSWNRTVLTEIYLCHACSDDEFEDGIARIGRHPLLASLSAARAARVRADPARGAAGRRCDAEPLAHGGGHAHCVATPQCDGYDDRGSGGEAVDRGSRGSRGARASAVLPSLPHRPATDRPIVRQGWPRYQCGGAHARWP
jgi:hypothetical protein